MLTAIVLKIHDISSPAADDNDATSTETDLARRVGELQALVLGLGPRPGLLASEQAAASQAGLDESVRDTSGLSDHLGTVQDEQTADDAVAKRLAGGKAPPDAGQVIIPDPEQLKQAAMNGLSGEYSAEGLENPLEDPVVTNPALASVQDESPIDAAVDLTNQARYLQENSGPCAGCVRPPANPEDNPVEPPDEHVVEP